MPDAEPVIGTGGTDVAPAADIVDLTDAAESEVEEATPPESGPTGDPEAEPTTIDRMSSDPRTAPAADGKRDRLRKIGAIAFIATVLIVAAAVTLTRSPFFYADTIEVRGTAHLNRADVLRVAAITAKTNVFMLDAGAAEARLEREPWIAGATITKDLPSTLIIDVHERVAVAVTESGGVLRLVADDGALLEAALPREAAGLPTIASTDELGLEPAPEAVEGAARAIAAMVPTLRHRIDGVSVLADGQLQVDLSSGAEVAYGEAVDLVEKAMALRALLDYAAGNGTSVISADVRIPAAPTAVLSGGVVVTP